MQDKYKKVYTKDKEVQIIYTTPIAGYYRKKGKIYRDGIGTNPKYREEITKDELIEDLIWWHKQYNLFP